MMSRNIHYHSGELSESQPSSPAPDLVNVLPGVLVGHVAGGDVQLEVGAEVFEVVIVGQLVGDFLEGKALIFNLSA